jgi:hypothetical protein
MALEMGSLETNRRFLHFDPGPPEMENPKDMFETWLRVKRSPPCPVQPSLLRRGVPAGRATPRPSVRPRHRAVTAPSARAVSAGVGRLDHGVVVPGQQCWALG